MHRIGCVSPLSTPAKWAGPQHKICPTLNKNEPFTSTRCVGSLEMALKPAARLFVRPTSSLAGFITSLADVRHGVIRLDAKRVQF
jgi:hypothetical protein